MRIINKLKIMYKKGILLIFIMSFFSGCSRNLNVRIVDITLKSISFTTNKFVADSVTWFYPYQMTFNFMATHKKGSNLNSNLKAVPFKVDKIYIRCKKANSSRIWTSKSISIGNIDTLFFNAYLLKSPIFDSIYSSKEFEDYLNDLRKCKLYFKLDDEPGREVRNVRVEISKDFHFNFFHWKRGKIDVTKIGYPSNNIPDSIAPVRPLKGIEY